MVDRAGRGSTAGRLSGDSVGRYDDGMNALHIGESVRRLRTDRAMTQEDVAAWVGVSKASVSKWERGLSQPDIALLPDLASLFDVSIDKLLDYEPRMSRDQLRAAYRRLSERFGREPFAQVAGECRELAKRYYACAPVVMSAGLLLVNNCHLADEAERGKVLREALGWFRRVREIAGDVSEADQARQMEAYCLLRLGLAQEAVGLLDDGRDQITQSCTLLASAYRALGRDDEARQTLQVGVYQHLVNLMNMGVAYCTLARDERECDETYRRFAGLADAFDMARLHPMTVLPLHLTAATRYAELGSHGRALEALRRYAAVLDGDIFPLSLHGDGWFDLIDRWVDRQVELGAYPPRDERMIREDLIASVVDNPAFEPLRDDPGFQVIVRNLRRPVNANESENGRTTTEGERA